jgi:iron complex transport system permease protein
VVAVVAVAISAAAGVLIGPTGIDPAEVGGVIVHHLFGLGGPNIPPAADAIVWDLRLPRVLTGAAVGAGLGVCGAVMQGLTRNPLADPYLLGLSSGAALGAVLVLLVGLPGGVPVAAFAGSLLALGASLALARSFGGLSPTRTVLAGLAVTQAASACVGLVVFASAKGDAFREVLGWLMGSLAGATWQAAGLTMAVCVIVGGGLVACGGVLDAFALGDVAATSMGVRVAPVRRGLLVATALLTGVLVSQSGAIGFVGLVVPHAVRMVAGGLNRRVLPLAGLVGAFTVIWADVAARTVLVPNELPVGILTAGIGAPVFAVLLWRDRSLV